MEREFMSVIYVDSLEQLKNIEVKSNIVLTQDLDCGGAEIEFLAKLFKGTFDGQGHTISNLTLTSEIWTDGQILALFQYLDHASVENVSFNDLVIKVDLNGYKPKIAALCYESMHSIIRNVCINAKLIGCEKIPMIDTALKGVIENISFESGGRELQKILYCER